MKFVPIYTPSSYENDLFSTSFFCTGCLKLNAGGKTLLIWLTKWCIYSWNVILFCWVSQLDGQEPSSVTLAFFFFWPVFFQSRFKRNSNLKNTMNNLIGIKLNLKLIWEEMTSVHYCNLGACYPLPFIQVIFYIPFK